MNFKKRKHLLISTVAITLLLASANNVKAETEKSTPEQQENRHEKLHVTESGQDLPLSLVEDKKGTQKNHINEHSTELQSRQKNQSTLEDHLLHNDTIEEKAIFEAFKDVLSENKMQEIIKFQESHQFEFDLLTEAITNHLNQEFDKAIIVYDKVLKELSTYEENDLKNMIVLITNFNELAKSEESLFELQYSEILEKDSPLKGKESVTVNETEESVPAHLETEVVSKDKVPENNHAKSKSTFAVNRQKKLDRIRSERNISYNAKLKRSTDGINTLPYGTPNYKTIRLVNDWVGREVRITKEAVTDRATWAYIRVLGTNISGWIDKAGLDIETVSSEKEVFYSAVLTRQNDGINTHPYGTEGYETIRTVGKWLGKGVRVTKEAVTPRATWAYIEVVGTDIAGWIDKAGLKKAEIILSERNIRYVAKLDRASDGINTRPYGTLGYETIRVVNGWVGRSVRITKEAVTDRATWAYVQVIGTNISGWIDKEGIDIESVTSETDVLYGGTLTRSSDGINTRPYGTEGYETLRIVGDWVDREVRVTKEAITPRATWAYVEVVGTNTKGWIDKAGLDTFELITSERNIQYEGQLVRANDGINSRPHGTKNYKTNRLVGNLVGRRVRISKEAVTDKATWSYIQVVGTNISGWIDKEGIAIESILSEKDVDYNAYLIRANDGINSRPYGTEGYETIRLVNDLVDSEVRVRKEAVTQRATWVFIDVVGKNISGWIDKAGIHLGSVAIRNTYYNSTFQSVLETQLKSGTPKTDRYGDLNKDGDVWEDAKRADVAYYLNPENFAPVKNGSTVSNVDRIQISTAGLNVRTSPVNGTVLGVSRRNEVYDVIGEVNGWYNILFDGRPGWVSGTYVSPISNIQYKNAIDNSQMLQFLSLSSASGISASDLNKELKGKGILEGMGQAFIEASRLYNINEIYLVSHALLETGHGTSRLATGVVVDGVKVYNMFGIGAYDGMAVEAGSRRAYNEGWNTPEKAIIGGARFIADTYINSETYRQDTLYKMRWNPANPSVHQYATDIGWAVKQTRSLDKILELSEKYNLTLRFDIPIYK